MRQNSGGKRHDMTCLLANFDTCQCDFPCGFRLSQTKTGGHPKTATPACCSPVLTKWFTLETAALKPSAGCDLHGEREQLHGGGLTFTLDLPRICFSPGLVLKEIHHYWKYSLFVFLGP